MKWPSYIPNPGSDEAGELGCLCPVMDNGHGAGYLGGVRNDEGEVVFVFTEGCPLHCPAPSEEAERLRGE